MYVYVCIYIYIYIAAAGQGRSLRPGRNLMVCGALIVSVPPSTLVNPGHPAPRIHVVPLAAITHRVPDGALFFREAASLACGEVASSGGSDGLRLVAVFLRGGGGGRR